MPAPWRASGGGIREHPSSLPARRVEQLFRYMCQQLANQVFADMEVLKEVLVKVLRRLWAYPEVGVHLITYS